MQTCLQLFGGVLYRQDEALHQEVVACCVYRLLGQVLHADQRLDG